MHMYQNHLSSFSSSSDGAFSTVPEGSLAVVGAVRKNLQTLYEGYFKFEMRGNSKRSAGDVLNETQGAFVKLMTDFEVVPELASKSIAYQVFREVAAVRDVPSAIKGLVLGEAGRNVGRNFSYVHFAVSIALMAQRCFAEDGSGTVIRLFEWMDASKGRSLFLAQCPGYIPSGGTAAFRLLPASLPEECESQIPEELQRRRRSSLGMVDPSQIANPAKPRASLAGTVSFGAEGVCRLSPSVRQLIQQIFGHYAAIGDPLNRSSMSTSKFHRCLRDCGIISSEVASSSSRPQSQAGTPGSITPGRSSVVGFSPPSRRASASSLIADSVQKAAQGACFGRTNSTGSLQRRSTSIPNTARSNTSTGLGSPEVLRRSSFTVSPSKLNIDTEDTSGLPLRVFFSAPLKQVDADLIFLQAMREADLQPAASSSGRRSSSVGMVGASQKRASVSTPVRRSHMTAEGFTRALADVASRCMPECASKAQALQDFASKVLEPLSEALQVKGEDVEPANTFLSTDEAQRLFARCRQGLEKVYNLYATELGGCRPHWSSDSMSRFAQDFDLIPEVGYLPLMKVLKNSTHFDACRGKGADGEMLYGTFEVALVLIAQRMISVQADSGTVDKVMHLFNRMNQLASASALSTRLDLQGSALMNVPKASSLSGRPSLVGSPQARSVASPGATPARPEKGRYKESDMSWAEVMTASPQ